MSKLIHKNQLFSDILINPAKDFDTICMVSGFATPAMAVHHMDAIKDKYNGKQINVKLLVGMTPWGIPKAHHENFVNLSRERSGSFECSYIKSDKCPVHSKIYIWLKNDKPELAFISSANYTISAFKRFQDEIGCVCDPISAYNYYCSAINNSIYCSCPESTDMAKENVVFQNDFDIEKDINENRESVLLPLFSERDKKIHDIAGLNWGQRPGREPNQAYIPIPKRYRDSNFFPERGEQFSVLTDDGYAFICVVAQDDGKAIETTNNNSEFGEYFRHKLGVPLGVKVELADLDRYGNRYVKFTKINEEEYYMEYIRDSKE